MEHLSSSEKLDIKKQLTKYIRGPTKAARRKIAIQDIEKIIGQKNIWKWFSFPIYIPTEWIEGWKETLILHTGKKSDKLFELLKASREIK